MNTAVAVFKKELIDALRDRKTLMAVLLSAVLIGPIVLVILSSIISDIESRAEKREIYAAGIEHAPTLANYIARQTYTIKAPPADFEVQLKKSKFASPVLVIPKDFEEKLAKGDAPELELISDSANRNASVGVGNIKSLINGFGRERSALTLASRGVAPAALKTVDMDEKDLANANSRAAQFTGMLPFFLISAILYGALNAALDSTAGERERGSLEPLLTNPASHLQMVIGKWGAVASVGILIAVLSALSFFPAQWLIKSESLQAMFQYGPKEAIMFIVVLVPFAAALSAVLMAVAIRCKTFKEAQASNTFVILAVSMVPLVTVMNPSGEQPWHLAVPGLAQNLVMTRVLKGEALDAMVIVVPTLVCVVITVACLLFIARSLKSAAVK
jgi:sodium transport system permease protein